MIKTIKIASRASDLALRQANIAIEILQPIFGESYSFEIIKIITTGDKIQNQSLQEIGGKALFTKEIEEALIACKADIAVHSMKDVTAHYPEDLTFLSFFKRGNPQDALISRYKSIEELPKGASIGTSSSRRKLFVDELRDDLKILPLRGNVPTRIKAQLDGKYDAIILAAAGLERLRIDEGLYSLLSYQQFIPAICQGVIGLQTRKDWKYNELVMKSSHELTTITTRCERRFLQFFNADCKTPIAGYARIQGDSLNFTGMFAGKDGGAVIKSSSGEIKKPEELANQVAEQIKKCIL